MSTTMKFARPAPPRLVDIIPAPDEAKARRIVEMLARSKATEQVEEERDA